MENSENTTAALGVDLEERMKDTGAFWLVALMILMSAGNEPPRERELAERLAYLTGKVETLEKGLFGP